jgi:hypothetical protein
MRELEKFQTLKRTQSSVNSITNNHVRRYIQQDESIKYPFKTLILTPDSKLWLGGDRIPQEIATLSGGFFGQLVNKGGKQWEASYNENRIIKFLEPVKNLNIRNFDFPNPVGFGYWFAGIPTYPESNREQTLLSGDLSTQNWVLRDRASGADGIPLEEYLLSSSVNYAGGIPQETNGLFELFWSSRLERYSEIGSGTYQVILYIYDSTRDNPVAGVSGVFTKAKNLIDDTDTIRAEDFSSYEVVRSRIESTTEITSVTIPFVGTQSRDWIARNNITETLSLSDVRTTGAQGLSASYTLNSSKIIDQLDISPLYQGLRGNRCFFCVEFYDGVTTTSTTVENRSCTVDVVTRTIVPGLGEPPYEDTQQATTGMDSPIFYAYNSDVFIVSAALIGSGPNGGWFAGGSPDPINDIGLPSPAPSIQRYGEYVPSLDPQFSAIYAFFDSAYTDNKISWPRVYSEYQYQITGGTSNLWDRQADFAPELGRVFSLSKTITEVFDYPLPRKYLLLTEYETLEIDSQVARIIPGVQLAAMSITSTTLTIIGNGNIAYKTSILRQQRLVTTENIIYPTGATTPTTQFFEEINTWTSDNLPSIVGMPCEVYRIVGEVITHWIGTVTVATGVRSPSLPSGANIFIGAYPQTISVNNFVMLISSTETVPFCPYRLEDNSATVVINPDYAILEDNIFDPSIANIVYNENSDNLATVYVCNTARYVPSKTNYAAVWDFVKQPNGKARIVKRLGLLKGPTKPHTGATDGELQTVQYHP